MRFDHSDCGGDDNDRAFGSLTKFGEGSGGASVAEKGNFGARVSS